MMRQRLRPVWKLPFATRVSAIWLSPLKRLPHFVLPLKRLPHLVSLAQALGVGAAAVNSLTTETVFDFRLNSVVTTSRE
jgi:hypothetical protein